VTSSLGLAGLGRRLVGVFVLVALMLGLFAMFAPPAMADNEMVRTRFVYTDPESGERVPAVGVLVTVDDSNGEFVGEGESDADGVVEIPVAGPGVYGMTVDPESLPEGVFLLDVERATALVEVLPDRTGQAIFQLGNEDEVGAAATGRVTARAIVQLTVEGLKFGVFLAMAAIGLSLIFGTTGLINFAHGELIGWGMLWAFMFNFYGFAGIFGFMEGWPAPFGSGVNLALAIPIAVLFGMGFGWAADRFVFRPMRIRGVSLIAAMIVTLGLSILIRYVYLFLFSGVPRFYRDYTAQSAIDLGPIQITPKDLITAGISVAILIFIGLFLQQTRMGKAMRAVSDDRDLAESSGINVQRVISVVWVMGGGLAALGGVFIGLSEQVSWNIGFRILLLIFAAVVLGGLGTAYGALVGALVVGVGIQLSTLWIPTELKNVGALVLLIIALLIRPQGILGSKQRVG